MASNEVVLSIRLPADLHERAKAKAAADERSLNQLIRLALSAYLDRGHRLFDRIEDLEDEVAILRARLDPEPTVPFDQAKRDLGL